MTSDDFAAIARRLKELEAERAAPPDYAVAAEMQRRIAAKWAVGIGGAMHPDHDGDSYTWPDGRPLLSDEDCDAYDCDMDALFEGPMDPYDACMSAWSYVGINDDMIGKPSADFVAAVAAYQPFARFRVGQRVRLGVYIEAYPTYQIHAGETGTVAAIGSSMMFVRLDAAHPELAEWDNHLHVHADHTDEGACSDSFFDPID